ncbi:MAG: TolC family protein [Bacillota bacterium]|nr:TolC family protein [Bacillota bacterium]
MNRFWKKGISLFLCTVLMTGMLQAVHPVQAGQYTLLLSQAKAIALANSDSYRKIKSKIALKEVSYKQAVKSINLKIKNKTTFRWSPLLNFKFPDKLNFEDESQMVYKPLQIKTEITTLKHDLKDEVYGVYEKTEQAFLKVYTLQEKIAFEKRQVEELQKTLQKNQGRLILGLATQNDVDAMEKNIKAAEDKLSQDMIKFENEKEKLGSMLNMDVTTQYTFMNPYIDADIPRTELEGLIQYTLDNDQTYYDAKLDTALSKTQLETNFNLMKKQYGSDINIISPYVQQVLNGQKIDSSSFKLSYDKFLTKIDAPWQGTKKILFIRFPREWLKGQIDGVRYVEDEPYALYENALEYQDLLAEQNQIKKDLEMQVKDSYESVASARAAYLKLKADLAETKEELQKEKVLNSLGELTFEEYTEYQKQYEDMQMETLEALETYSSLLYSLDRLTCGAVTSYLNGADVTMGTGEGGESYIVDEEAAEGAKYYITSLIEDNMFEFGVYVPDDFETDITHYELWVDDYMIGSRTEIDKTIRHLTLSLTGEERVFVRVYNDTEFVDDCEIDAMSYEGPLDIKGYVVSKSEEAKIREIGSYEVKPKNDMGVVEIELTINGAEDIHYYAVRNNEGVNLLSEEAMPITSAFVYLNFLTREMDTLQIQCYDASKAEKVVAYFDSANQSIYVVEE